LRERLGVHDPELMRGRRAGKARCP
jgi:hypothetical protein